MLLLNTTILNTTILSSFFTEDINFPRQVIATLKNDGNGLPNFRIRVKKGKFSFEPA